MKGFCLQGGGLYSTQKAGLVATLIRAQMGPWAQFILPRAYEVTGTVLTLNPEP